MLLRNGYNYEFFIPLKPESTTEEGFGSSGQGKIDMPASTVRKYWFEVVLRSKLYFYPLILVIKVPRKAFNIGEVWNPVCCYGNKTVEFVLWDTFRRIVQTTFFVLKWITCRSETLIYGLFMFYCFDTFMFLIDITYDEMLFVCCLDTK